MYFFYTGAIMSSLVFLICGVRYLHACISRIVFLFSCIKNDIPKKNIVIIPETLPRICVIVPVKLETNKSMDIQHCWKSHLHIDYVGTLFYIFVVESNDSIEIPLVENVIYADKKVRPSLHARVLVAGKCTQSSQKIHNMIAALRTPEAESATYIQFLDICCQIHPSTITWNVCMMEENIENNCFLISGCPIDIPVPNANIWSWVLCQFRHESMLTSFSTPNSGYVWGGHMFIRYTDIKPGSSLYHKLKCAYSDDMTIYLYMLEAGLVCKTPLYNIFLNNVRGNISFFDVWDFLRRQCFAITQYYSVYGRVQQYRLYAMLMIVHFNIVYNMFLCIYYLFYNPTVSLYIVCVFLCLLYLERCILRSVCIQISYRHAVVSVCVYFSSMLVLSPMLLCAAVVTLIKSSVVWSNIRYTRSYGKLVLVHHRN